MTDSTLLILIVDDEPAHAEAVRRALQSVPGVCIETANSLATYRAMVTAQPPALALVDLNLPDGRAVGLLTSPPEAGCFPIVVMTSHGNEGTAVEAMKAGAIDYIVKSAEAFADMPHTVERALREWNLHKKRRQAEEALRESEERHRVLFQRSHDALMTLIPPNWRYGSGNSAAITLFAGRDEADFLSHSPWQYSPERQPDGRASEEKFIELLETAMREGSLFFDWTHKRLSGEEFPATVLLTRLELHGSALLEATVRDESAMRRLQASLAQADRLASMGMVAAGVAHEINNPLSYVQYNIQSLAQDLPKLKDAVLRSCAALRERVGDAVYAEIVEDSAQLLEPAMLADAVERAEEALEGVQRIAAISRTLGTFSRSDRVMRAQIDLRIALESAINMAHNELRHHAHLVMELGEVPLVWATEGKLSQVFLNLLVNATHAIDEGDAQNNQISVRTWTDGGEACVEVADSGKGIPVENLERIFEPFFTTKPRGAGTGLGLSICRNILLEFGGSLRVESEVGKGTRFVVRLPAATEVRQESGGLPRSDAPHHPLVRGRILVVDDEDSIRRALNRLLGPDHEVVIIASGLEARTVLTRDTAFDVVLCDLMMPQMSGMELHTWLQDHDAILAKRMVFITGGAFTPKASEYLVRVGNLTLEKPFDTEGLRRKVSGLVRQAKGLAP